MSWSARDIMRREVRTVAPGTRLSDLDRDFFEQRVGAFPVVDGERLVGIVSRSDVVRQLSVEQSVGELLAEQYRDLCSDETASGALEVIARHVGRRMESLRVEDVMIDGLVTTTPDASVQDVARLLLERRIHRIPVVEEGRLIGIVSSFDFVRLFAEGAVEAG